MSKLEQVLQIEPATELLFRGNIIKLGFERHKAVHRSTSVINLEIGRVLLLDIDAWYIRLIFSLGLLLI